MKKINAVKFEINRAEGPRGHEDVEVVQSWDAAESLLHNWSTTAPKDLDGGCHKCDFTITFADGLIYKGGLGLVHWTRNHLTLSEHIRLLSHERPGFLEKYDIPEIS
jgi:hypothetical protein